MVELTVIEERGHKNWEHFMCLMGTGNLMLENVVTRWHVGSEVRLQDMVIDQCNAVSLLQRHV